MPAGVAGGGGWVSTSSRPAGFDPDAVHDSPEELAESFAAALDAGFAGPRRPRFELTGVVHQAGGRAIVLVSELGAGDDSVAGSQYAVVARSLAGGWTLDLIFARPLCLRGVAADVCL